MKRLIVALLLVSSAAQAKDVALILDDAAQRDMVAVLNAARLVPDLNIVTPVSHILEKLKVAPVVTEQAEPPKEEPKKEEPGP